MDGADATIFPTPGIGGGPAFTRLVLPEPLGAIRPVRTEHQRWQRHRRAEGELLIGRDAADRAVRVEYHWVRWLSLADPGLADVYTAELWARRPDGDWLYLLRPGRAHALPVSHRRVAPLLRAQLGVDVAD
jgi:hypothetical protein